MKEIHMEFKFYTEEEIDWDDPEVKEGFDPRQVLASGIIEHIADTDRDDVNENFVRNLLVLVGMYRDKAEVQLGKDGL